MGADSDLSTREHSGSLSLSGTHVAADKLLLPQVTDRVVTLSTAGYWVGRVAFDDPN